MKKIIVVLLALLLVGCSAEKTTDNSIDNLSIAVPAGAPSICFYNEIDNEHFATGDAQSILPELKGENGSDIIVIDTVNGIKALNAGANYKLAATITFGNFYLASTGNDDDNVLNDGDYIVLFSQGATPDLIFHYVFGNSLDSNIHYVAAVSDASACLIKGINISDDQRTIDEEPYVDYVMIAEPALSAALSQNEKAFIYADIQDRYKEASKHPIVQASVFVSNRLSKEAANAYLDKLNNDIEKLLSNPDIFADAVEDLADAEIKEIFGVPNAKIVKKVLTSNSIGIGFRKAYDNKESIDNYISIFGMDKTNEEIYFK